MKPIHERTKWSDYTVIERCQETGRAIEVYSREQERKVIWASMTPDERMKLFRVRQLICIEFLKWSLEEKKEFTILSNWMEFHKISVDDIPENI